MALAFGLAHGAVVPVALEEFDLLYSQLIIHVLIVS